MVKKNVLLIVNPISGGVEKSEIVETTTDFVNALGMNLVLYETSGKKDILHIQDLYDKFNPDRVIIAGGDAVAHLARAKLAIVRVVAGVVHRLSIVRIVSVV